jgi:hypothetical protein
MRALIVTAFAALACAGCFVDDATGPAAIAGTTVAMDFTGKAGFYASPFPSDTRLTAAGGVDIGGFPNPSSEPLVTLVTNMISTGAHGFSSTSAVLFPLSGPIDETALPSLAQSIVAGSSVVLMGAEPTAPDYLKRYPVSSSFLADGGPYGPSNLLSVLPLQGVPLRPATRYVAAVMRGLGDASGKPLGVSESMSYLVGGLQPAGMGDAAFASYQAGVSALVAAKIDVTEVAGLAVFTTDTPGAELDTVTKAMLAAPQPVISMPFAQTDLFSNYCVYATTIPMPEYQGGVPPYNDTGGGWVFDANGEPVLQRMEEANYYVTVPRSVMPAAGYPVMVLSRTGAGGNRPLVDRGAAATNGGPAIIPGSGPALYYAAAGFAGSEIDGPLGGLRNTTNANEDYTIFNVSNPVALRDNLRQSAAELSLQAHILDGIFIDVSDCPGAVAPGGLASFDTGTMGLMGHSMGATIIPLTLAIEPRYRVGLLSGAGGSWIENIIFKELPIVVKPIANALLGILPSSGYPLTVNDPMLSMFQWAAEAADPPVYDRRIVEEPTAGPPRSILMMQGIVDHYIMDPIADATSLSIGLDLAGAELDDNPGEGAALDPVVPLLPFVGRRQLSLPVARNISPTATAVVSQFPGDDIEDGHEVVFQTDPPKHAYRCFLLGLLAGVPRVPTTGAAFDPCD